MAEAVRRIAFCFLIGNGDAHLKNWSLIYQDRKVPTLAPAYDLVATAPYAPSDEPEDMGLKIDGSRRFSRVNLDTFRHVQNRLERRFGPLTTDLADVAADTAGLVREAWEQAGTSLQDVAWLHAAVDKWITTMSARLVA